MAHLQEAQMLAVPPYYIQACRDSRKKERYNKKKKKVKDVSKSKAVSNSI